MSYSLVILLLLFTSCCYGIPSAPERFLKNYDWRLKTRCYVPYLFPFKTNLCPVTRRYPIHRQNAEDIGLEQNRGFRTRQLQYDDEDDDDEAINTEMLENSRFEAPQLAFRVIGCGMVTIFVGITIIIYVTSNMFYPDTLSQICSEICLLSAYTGILLITTDSMRVEDSGFCIGVSIFLQFAFLSYFLFALIEVICMMRLLYEKFPKWVFPSIKSVLLIGWGTPVAVTIVSAAALHNQYTARNNCWLNLGKNAIWPTVIPVGIFVGVQLLGLIAVIMVSEVPYMLSQQEYDRARCFITTRYASSIIMIVALVAWSSGLTATHKNSEGLFVAFTVSSILLGAVILILRISTDPLVRRVIALNVFCLFVKSNRSNKVNGWSDKVLRAKEVLPKNKQEHNINHHELVNGGNQQMVSHK